MEKILDSALKLKHKTINDQEWGGVSASHTRKFWGKSNEFWVIKRLWRYRIWQQSWYMHENRELRRRRWSSHSALIMYRVSSILDIRDKLEHCVLCTDIWWVVLWKMNQICWEWPQKRASVDEWNSRVTDFDLLKGRCLKQFELSSNHKFGRASKKCSTGKNEGTLACLPMYTQIWLLSQHAYHLQLPCWFVYLSVF
jgi:hypothetical protein